MMVNHRAQSAMEWLMTHSWAVLVVMTVGLAMFHLGVFDTTATPSIKGFSGGGPRPLAGQVQYYRDGIMMLTLVNPYDRSVRLEWIDVAPLSDRSDRLKTYIGDDLDAGEIGIYYVNASNVHPAGSAFIVPLEEASGDQSVSCAVWIRWGLRVGDRTSLHLTTGEIYNAPYVDQDSPGISGPGGGDGDDIECAERCYDKLFETGSCYESSIACTSVGGMPLPIEIGDPEDPCSPGQCCCISFAIG